MYTYINLRRLDFFSSYLESSRGYTTTRFNLQLYISLSGALLDILSIFYYSTDYQKERRM